MTLTLANPHGPDSEQDIAAAEASLGVTFPPTYRRYLTETGGGYTGDRTVPMTNGSGVLLELYTASDVGTENAPDERVGFIEHVPHQYLIIGDGAGGALFLLPSSGDVWWADYDKAAEHPDEVRDDIMIRLADDFDTFLTLFD